jgi:hypothetical protein
MALKAHIDSPFDDFLEEEGLLATCEASALQSTCSIRLNHRHKLIGHVLSDRSFASGSAPSSSSSSSPPPPPPRPPPRFSPPFLFRHSSFVIRHLP